MPIINQIVKGSGTTPTGTKSITTNGIYDVTDYANADVQVPTTAPVLYQKMKFGSGNITKDGGTVPDFSATINCQLQSFLMANMFNGVLFDTPTQIDFSKIYGLGDYSLYYAFNNCSNLIGKVVLELTSSANNALNHAFAGTGITEFEIKKAGWTSQSDVIRGVCANCLSLSKVSILVNRIMISSSYNQIREMFNGCTALTTVDVSQVVDFGTVGVSTTSTGPINMFGGCSSLKTIKWDSLYIIYKYQMNQMYNQSGIEDIYLSSLKTLSDATSLSNSLLGTSGCKLHIPSNMQSTVESQSGYSTQFGGTNATILFDLPATNTLTGADSNTYSRNPKYDTATALAWKIGAYGTTNFTPAYYTSGTTDPAVSDTIYSDVACTTAETTISSIA